VAGTDLHGSHVVLCRHAPSPDDVADTALLPRPCRQPARSRLAMVSAFGSAIDTLRLS
jgi:hypothetical protein